MVNAKEFRIGNVVLDKFGKTIIIESINESGINLRGGDGNGVYPDFGFEEIFKIPLTEEILLKCGFEKNFIDDVFEIGEFSIRVDELDCVFMWNGFCIDINLKYLHQLQNLYFVLTNEELILNL